ncbi:MAG: hypothetical protein AAF333_14490 [Planctomycetota bacterium]
MSAKYKRVKQADLALPAPLRWLTRAFSSITLAVILLCLVALYGVLGSVPVYFLAIGGAWLVILVVLVGAGCWLGVKFANDEQRSGGGRLVVGGLIFLAGIASATVACLVSVSAISRTEFFTEHKATVIYRLPAIEMNETEFFSWWPMQLLLVLFVVNMIWATVRRIEFKFVNLGVLTVHTGIVTVAVGSILYGQLKLEGDMFIVRSDLPGGQPVAHFYDRVKPAVFVGVDRAPMMQFPLINELPRYNDYKIGELDITLHDRQGFAERLGEDLRLTIPGFIAYGEFERVWVEAPEAESSNTTVGPAITVARGERDTVGDGRRETLPAARPAQRLLETESWAIEYLHSPNEQRVADLLTEAPRGVGGAPHLLFIEVPDQNHREVRAIAPGDTFDVESTGYRIAVEEIGPYGLPFVTEGYEGATDTHARLGITGEHIQIQRYALHRYPERSQDFVDGTRGDPDPGIRTVYLDQTKIQYHLMTGAPAIPGVTVNEDGSEVFPDAEDRLWVLLRVAGIKPVLSPLAEQKLPLVDPDKANAWLHVVERLERAVPAQRPVVTPKLLRDPKLEGTYEHALLPVRVEYDLRDENFEKTGETFSRIIWLRQMPYLEQRGGEMIPQTVNIPGYGSVQIAFGRQRRALPFAVAMTDFTMTPYAGSDIPRDFESDLLVYPVDERGRPDGTPERFSPRLNNPAIVRMAGAPLQLAKVKLSQAGWDPGDPDTPPAMKQLRDEQGRLVNQQRFTILGVGNNVGIRIVFVGSVLIALGIPWAFYIKPWLIKRKARRFTAAIVEQNGTTDDR